MYRLTGAGLAWANDQLARLEQGTGLDTALEGRA
jgi:hypothetical protein